MTPQKALAEEAQHCLSLVVRPWQRPQINFREREYCRQATFRSTWVTNSSNVRAPTGKEGRQYPYMIALGYEDENLYPTLRGAAGVRLFFDDRTMEWWRNCTFEEIDERVPTRNMQARKIACVNFVLPQAESRMVCLLCSLRSTTT